MYLEVEPNLSFIKRLHSYSINLMVYVKRSLNNLLNLW